MLEIEDKYWCHDDLFVRIKIKEVGHASLVFEKKTVEDKFYDSDCSEFESASSDKVVEVLKKILKSPGDNLDQSDRKFKGLILSKLSSDEIKKQIEDRKNNDTLVPIMIKVVPSDFCGKDYRKNANDV